MNPAFHMLIAFNYSWWCNSNCGHFVPRSPSVKAVALSSYGFIMDQQCEGILNGMQRKCKLWKINLQKKIKITRTS
jgi:hypothetical protein